MSKQPYQELLYQVGSALHSWSIVEMDLSRYFGSLYSELGSQALFASVISFDTRLAMIDRLTDLSHLSSEDKAVWRKLSARLSKFYKKRHEVAHFTLGKSQKGEDVIFPFLTVATIGDKHKRQMTASQVGERVDKFMEFGPALAWFANAVVRSRMPAQARTLPPLEEPPLVARLRELVVQTPRDHG